MIVRPYPGLIWIERFLDERWLRTDAAYGWGPRWQALDEWKRQVHVIERAALTPDICAALCVELPEQQLGDESPWMRRMFAAVRLVMVREDERRRLLELGLRVYTIGYHRVPDLLRIVAVGGGQPTLWIQQSLWSFYQANPRVTELVPELPWIDGPREPPWYLDGRDLDRIDRILRAATGGAVDAQSLDLAVALAGFTDFASPEHERRRKRAEPPEDVDYLREFADEQWARELIRDHEHPLAGPTEDLEFELSERYPLEPDAELLAAFEALVAGEPESVDVDQSGSYQRERVPALRLVRLNPRAEGWADADWLGDPEPLWRDAPPELDEGYLYVPATHRYVRIG